jgi:hypothetical protein
MDFVWVVGTLVSVGPRVRERWDTLYRYLEFDEPGGYRRRVRKVRANADVAALVRKGIVGQFVFWSRANEVCLWCVGRPDGTTGIDLGILHMVVLWANRAGTQQGPQQSKQQLPSRKLN